MHRIRARSTLKRMRVRFPPWSAAARLTQSLASDRCKLPPVEFYSVNWRTRAPTTCLPAPKSRVMSIIASCTSPFVTAGFAIGTASAIGPASPSSATHAVCLSVFLACHVPLFPPYYIEKHADGDHRSHSHASLVSLPCHSTSNLIFGLLFRERAKNVKRLVGNESGAAPGWYIRSWWTGRVVLHFQGR